MIDHIGGMRPTKADAGVLNGLYAQRLASGRKKSSRRGKGYSPAVVARAQQLRSEDMSLQATADRLREEFDEASHITKETLASLLRRQRATDAADESLQLSASTVNAVHVVLHKAFGAGVRWGRLPRNPADAADPPPVPARTDEVETWNADTLRRFLSATAESGDRLHALWVLLATTGMRRGKAVGLRWQDVELDAGCLRVVQTILSISCSRRAEDGQGPAPDCA